MTGTNRGEISRDVRLGVSRRDWWLGIGAIVLAVLLHALIPRYDWRDPGGDNPRVFVRIDRWTGQAQLGVFPMAGGSWTSR